MRDVGLDVSHAMVCLDEVKDPNSKEFVTAAISMLFFRDGMGLTLDYGLAQDREDGDVRPWRTLQS